jgi:hypothetical protein
VEVKVNKGGGGWDMVKHIVWRHESSRGRVAVKINGHGYLEMKTAGGKALPAELLFAVLDASHPGWRKVAEEQFFRNKDPWRVDIRQGMSGCLDFATRRLVDGDLAIVRTTARLHVTMFGKIREAEGLLGELAPIFIRLREHFPQAEAEMTVVEPQVRGFTSVSSTSLDLA